MRRGSRIFSKSQTHFLPTKKEGILYFSKCKLYGFWNTKCHSFTLKVMVQGNCGKMYKSRILSYKTGADCAEMFLDTIQQQKYMTPPQYSNPRQLFVWNKEKGKTLLIHINCRSICIFISLHNEDLKKIIQILFFSTATNESKDGFDIDITQQKIFP